MMNARAADGFQEIRADGRIVYEFYYDANYRSPAKPSDVAPSS